MPRLVTCEDSGERLIVDLARELSNRLAWGSVLRDRDTPIPPGADRGAHG